MLCHRSASHVSKAIPAFERIPKQEESLVIPIIGFMVGCYVNFRALDVWCRPKSSFSSEFAHTFMLIVAVLLMAVNTFCMIDLMSSSGSAVPKL
jgi:hypothetical protein